MKRPRNELRKIFRRLYFRGRTFINGKKQHIQVCRVWLGPERPVICTALQQREQQIAREKPGEGMSKSEHFESTKLKSSVRGGAYVRYLSLRARINKH